MENRGQGEGGKGIERGKRGAGGMEGNDGRMEGREGEKGEREGREWEMIRGKGPPQKGGVICLSCFW